MSVIYYNLLQLKNNFDAYFGDKMKKFFTKSTICLIHFKT